jgi:hypothetical protein
MFSTAQLATFRTVQITVLGDLWLSQCLRTWFMTPIATVTAGGFLMWHVALKYTLHLSLSVSQVLEIIMMKKYNHNRPFVEIWWIYWFWNRTGILLLYFLDYLFFEEDFEDIKMLLFLRNPWHFYVPPLRYCLYIVFMSIIVSCIIYIFIKTNSCRAVIFWYIV